MEEGGFEMINTDRLKLSIHWNHEVPGFASDGRKGATVGLL